EDWLFIQDLLIENSRWSSTTASPAYCNVGHGFLMQQATLGVGDFFCGSWGCRNHARLYRDPLNPTLIYVTASLEHADTDYFVHCGGHVLDSLLLGGSGFAIDLMGALNQRGIPYSVDQVSTNPQAPAGWYGNNCHWGSVTGGAYHNGILTRI